jgi:hypothetical protein
MGSGQGNFVKFDILGYPFMGSGQGNFVKFDIKWRSKECFKSGKKNGEEEGVWKWRSKECFKSGKKNGEEEGGDSGRGFRFEDRSDSD